ncbi:MAG TPA: immunoglobulin domain-containing protein [Methylomirabilota bacterium]|nr:immunoglobulin domain-containing protein [Methylomirabilota bacterium]
MTKTIRRLMATILALAALAMPSNADELRKLWQVAPGDITWLTTGATERGLAYNPTTGHVLVVSRAGGNNVWILDGETGAELGQLSMGEGLLSGNLFPINMIGVADDGAIYAANLAQQSGTPAVPPVFKIYRWENENATPTIAYEGDPANGESNQRWGDSLDVRGAGVNTEIIIGARNSASAALFRTTNGTDFTSTHIRNAGNGSGTLGIAFGEGNRVWLRLNGQPIRHVSYDLTTRNATLLNSFSSFPTGMAPIGVNPTTKQLAGIVIATPDTLNLYDLGDLNLGPIFIDSEQFPADNANGNNVGAIDFSTNKVFALNTGNGIVGFEIVKTTVPATIVTQPGNVTALEGASISLTVTASGSLPLTFQWAFEGTPISGATGTTLNLTNLQASTAGNYTVTVTNPGGSVTSSNAVVTVNPLVRSDILTKAWQIAPGDVSYVNTDSTQRGLAYNPVTGNVLLVTRTGGNKIIVLNGNTGASNRSLTIDPAIVTGGTFAINMVDVAADGAVYVANLNTDVAAAGQLAIYRWENDSEAAAPVTVYAGNPVADMDNVQNRRFGDTLDVRGAGADTQILMSGRNGTNLLVFTTVGGDPKTLAPTQIVVTNVPAGAFGLGAAFGEGNTIWAKTTSGTLRKITFPDLANLQDQRVELGAETIAGAAVATTIGPIGYDSTNKFLAGVAIENPDNLRLYNLADTNNITMVDQELFPTDNANINGTGAIAFGGGRVYVLNSNNGIVAFNFNPNATPQPARARLAAGALSGSSFTLNVTGTPNARYRVESTTNFSQWEPVTEVTIDADGTVTATDANATAQRRFYRAVAL